GVEVGPEGTFTDTFEVPGDAGTGELTVDVTDDEAPAFNASDSVTVVDGSIGVSPDEVEPGESVTVEGGGFAPGETITVEFEHADGSTWTETVDADDDGGFTLTWPVPGDAELGELDVTATGEDSDTSAEETVEIVAISSVDIAIEHEELPRLHEQVGYGSGYAPGTEVQGYMNSSPSIDLGTQVADENGNVTFTWEIPVEAEVDAHTFSLEADRYVDQSVTFEVVPPSIGVSPDEGEPGDTIVVDGDDFAPGETVTLEFEDSDGNTWSEEVSADNDGGFTLEWEVPEDVAPGTLVVTATADSGTATGSMEILTGTGAAGTGPGDRLPTAGLGGTTEGLALAGLFLLLGVGVAVRANRRTSLN
ncbi:MAG TPA: hypothetical protein VK053_00595, partial [Jiangellaceae bacterium]|nr:hypothetical protein [Jiangellaceae bacterium]